MKVEYEIEDDVYVHLASAVVPDGFGQNTGKKLSQVITGIIKKGERPEGSSKEDVTISILTSDQGQTQTAVVLVRTFIKDNPDADQYEPDRKRVKTLGAILNKILEVGGRGNNYSFRSRQQRIYKVEETNEHCIVNRIEYKCYNE